jgi:hypothetical protein
VPTQIILCIKEKNQKKINSHRWFFNASAPMLQVSFTRLAFGWNVLLMIWFGRV